MITAAGVGSGIDVESILTQLMEIERQPITKLEQKKERLDVELSAFASAKSLMGELATATRTLGGRDTVAPFVAASTDEAVFTATANGTAAAERHDIEVLELAAAHRIATTGYDSDQESVGPGGWSFSSGENAFDVTLEADDDSLRALRDAINDSPDNDSIVASLLDVDDGTRLVLTSRETGVDNAIDATRTTGGGGFLGTGTAQSRPFEEIVEASDARLRVDGFDVTRASNSIGDVIEGVTLDLIGAGTAALDTRRDLEAMKVGLDGFVASYNALRTELSSLGEGALQGDRLPRDVDSRLRTAFSTDITLGDGSTVNPVELGFTFDRYGALSLDADRLSARQEEGLEKLVDAYSRPVDGFAARLSEVLEEFTRADGRIAAREDGVEERKGYLDSSIDRQEYRLERVEERYRRQFTAMDRIVSELQSTSGFLAQKLQ